MRASVGLCMAVIEFCCVYIDFAHRSINVLVLFFNSERLTSLLPPLVSRIPFSYANRDNNAKKGSSKKTAVCLFYCA